MPREGIEPSRDCSHRFLRPERIPFRHLGNHYYLFYRYSGSFTQVFERPRPDSDISPGCRLNLSVYH
ncbi:MAG: hypothetical protein UX08_C0023G0002 [Candidatus Collierbacteria bacterium GW2011_GWB1_45_35]|uniref:Uncharacterized protein n=1 Tax=Candidatus Collierbacteria bacterium GW2011_GWA2_44_99 TaxID=1618380 RepID=A0A0G1KM53_9BACT|nr:MAG: hypothetical protein UW84_C0055G0002 [Candidatus Collierbacteria bacterium GW2011_GWA2_44_99]KKU04524.1 MAG: hypothetical protein UX08_C0023G0002 [Candidatus Collierbacteria bacterium GW2011_GWB1_45_35]KKU06823.1 MAG: hypothetical protein UX11_C0026G0010 [Candidatus Collierbacteria bacterium GW2011_GWC2_45_40]